MNTAKLIALGLLRGSGGVDRNAYADKVLGLFGANIVSYVPLWESAGPYAMDWAGSNDGTYNATGVTYAQTGIGDGRTSVLLDGSAGYVDMVTAVSSGFNGEEGTAFCWFKVEAGSWTDGAVRYLFIYRTSATNFVQIIKSSVNGRFEYTYVAGGTQKQYRREGSNETAWCSCAITWSKSNNRAICYLNGAQVGANMTGLGTWAGALTAATYGANVTPSNYWTDNLAHMILIDREATAAEIAAAHIIPVSVSDSLPFDEAPATISVASGGDIATAIATMRAGDILSLAPGGTYTFDVDVSGFATLPSGFSSRSTRVVGNGATVSGGDFGAYIASKSYISFEGINFSQSKFWNALVTNSSYIAFTDCDFYNPSTGSSFDCWRSDTSSFVTLTRCTAHSTTDYDGTRAHDGFELWGPCTDFAFFDCIAYDIKNGATDEEGHGFEVYGQESGQECRRVTFTNCEAYNCQVGFSCEGGPTSLAHEDIVCAECDSHNNAFYGYQGINGATLYRDGCTGGSNGVSDTNGSVVDL